MSRQKYRFDHDGETCPNGSIPIYAEWHGGPSLSGVKNCPVNDGDERRTVYVTAEADTFFTFPACCKMNGKKVVGYLSHDEAGYHFRYFEKEQDT